ncbi:MAG: DUF805 domain-containing protein [Zoogloeaceae bacterium]|jgi:uncharacterized membrane protein YhaH (DUF805 family)|nr:DUF805 domain-containing protein [Zoogloeaceae bacterium]
MSPATFRIRFDGTLTPGADIEAVKANLARLFRQERAKIEPLFAGRTVTIKRGLSEASARKYVDVLRQAGAAARMEAEEPAALALHGASPVAPDEKGVRKAPPPLELALVPKDPAPQASPPVAPSSPRPAQNTEHDNGSTVVARDAYKSPIEALADALRDREEYCDLRWFSPPLERIGRLRLMARSGVLTGMMLVVAFIGNGIIAHTISIYVGGIFAWLMMMVAVAACRLSNSSFMDEHAGVSLLDIALLFGVPVFLVILSMGMSFQVRLDPTGNIAGLSSQIVIFNSVLIGVARILLMTQQIRRLHDVHRSGWWCLLFLIPNLGLLFFLPLLGKSGDDEANEYGSPPPPNTLRVHLGAALFIAIFALFVLEATSLRLSARFPLGATTSPEAPQGVPRQSVVPPDIADALNLPRPQPQESSNRNVNDFAPYANQEDYLFRVFQQAGSALDTAERDAQRLERWHLGDAIERTLRGPITQVRAAIETQKRERATLVSSRARLPKFADIFDRGVGHTQDILERLEVLYADLLANAQSAGADKAAFQKGLDRFKNARNLLEQDHAARYAQTRREMCAYLRNPDDGLREYLKDPKHRRTEWCN